MDIVFGKGMAAGDEMGLPEHPHAQKIAEYRRRATDAAAHAAAARDDHMRKSWQNISASYQQMADRLERKTGY